MILIRLLLSFAALNLFSAQIPEYEKIANKFFKDFAQEAQQKFYVCCEGDCGSMPNDIESFGGFFSLKKKATIDDIRELEIAMLTLFQKRINENKDIQPFLREYPFPLARVNICLSFYDDDGRPWSDGSVTFLTFANSNMAYFIIDKETDNFKKIKEESIEEAISILKSQDKWNKEDNLVLYKTKK